MRNVPTTLSPEERFIDLLSGDTELISQEEQIVKELLEAGGFVIASIAKDKVMGRRLVSQDESEPYLANPTSGYRVVDQFEQTEPSSWLEMFWSKTLTLVRKGDREQALAFLREKLGLCRPLTPVVVNEFGETFRESYRQAGEKRSTDETNLTYSYVIHAYCDCFTDIRDTTPDHKVIVCRGCSLRVYIPKSVMTWGDLRRHFVQYNNQPV